MRVKKRWFEVSIEQTANPGGVEWSIERVDGKRSGGGAFVQADPHEALDTALGDMGHAIRWLFEREG